MTTEDLQDAMGELEDVLLSLRRCAERGREIAGCNGSGKDVCDRIDRLLNRASWQLHLIEGDIGPPVLPRRERSYR